MTADNRTLTLMLADELRDVAADLLRRADELTAAITDNCPPHGIVRPVHNPTPDVNPTGRPLHIERPTR